MLPKAPMRRIECGPTRCKTGADVGSLLKWSGKRGDVVAMVTFSG